MLTINDTLINIPGFEELKEFSNMYPIFKSSAITLAIDSLKEIESKLTEEKINLIWLHYSAIFGELFLNINNISELIDYDKVPTEIKGKLLNITISPINPLSTFL
jgi:hypothetical protein